MSAIGPALRRGAELFDAGRYIEAHEAWEDGWRALERPSAAARMLQGLAQCAAAAHKLRGGAHKGARSLARKGSDLLLAAMRDDPSIARGLALAEFAQAMPIVIENAIDDATELPRLITNRN